MGIARNILKTCHFPLPPATSGCVSPIALPTCYNSKPLTNQSTLEDASRCFLDGLFNRKVFNDNDRSPSRLPKQKASCDYKLDSFIHIPFEKQHSQISEVDRNITNTAMFSKTCSSTFLSIAKSSSDSRLWTWMNKLLIKIESLESTNNFFARLFLHCTKKTPPKKKGDNITPLLHLHTCWMLRNCGGYLWAAMPEQFHTDKTARIQKAQRR